jgi:hypothetical protein
MAKKIIEVKKPAGMPMPAVVPFRENATVPMIHEIRARLQELEAKANRLEIGLAEMEATILAVEKRLTNLEF